MQLFQTTPLHRIELFYLPVKGKENRSGAYINNMLLVNREKAEREFFDRKTSLVNYDNPFVMGRLFHDGRLHYQFNPTAIDEYIRRNYTDLNRDYFYNSFGSCFQGIYLLYAFEPGKAYVGSVSGPGRCFTDRWKEHLSNLKLGVHHCKRLQSIYNRNGGKVLPIIFFASNGNFNFDQFHKGEILKSEGSMIRALWENNYNKRKF